jgi:hypothetical protein
MAVTTWPFKLIKAFLVNKLLQVDAWVHESATTTHERSAGATGVAIAANDAAATDSSPSVLSIKRAPIINQTEY